MAFKRPVGRPLKIQTLEELETKIDEYFNNCDAKQKPYTMSGLALALDIDRDTLMNYEDKVEYVGTIARAKERCHEFAEGQLFGKAANGAAFSLKNNWGWEDRSKVEQETKGIQKIEIEIVDSVKTGNSESKQADIFADCNE